MKVTAIRRTVATVAAVASVAMLAACSSGETSDETTISWWSWEPVSTMSEVYIDAFEAEHPDINVEYRFLQYADYASTVLLGLQSGAGPDVFGTQVGGLSQQFAPFAEDLGPILEEALGDEWQSQLNGVDQLTIDGKVVGSPFMISAAGTMWANQTLVDELGLEVPTDYSELREFCAAVDASGLLCIAQGAKDTWQNLDVYQSIANQIAPGLLYDAIAGDVPFDDPALVESLTVWKQLFDDGVFDDGALGRSANPDAADMFFRGEAVLNFRGNWDNSITTPVHFAQLEETYGDEISDFEFVPYLAPAFVSDATTGLLFGGPDVGFGVSADSENKDAAETFVTWLTASEGGQQVLAEQVQQPALVSVPVDLSTVMTDRQKAGLEEQSAAVAEMVGARQIPDPDVEAALGEALQNLAIGQQTPEQAAADVQAAIDASLG